MPLAEFFQARIGRMFEEDMRDLGYGANGEEIVTRQPGVISKPIVFLLRWIDPGTDTKGSLRPESIDPLATDEDGANDIMRAQQQAFPGRIYWVVKNPENETRILAPWP